MLKNHVLFSGTIIVGLSFFRSSYFLGGVFVVLSYLVPGTLALDLPRTLTISRLWFFSVSLSVTTEFVSKMKIQDGHWVYC